MDEQQDKSSWVELLELLELSKSAQNPCIAVLLSLTLSLSLFISDKL